MKKVLVVISFALFCLCVDAQDSVITVSEATQAVDATPPLTSCANRLGAATSIPCPPLPMVASNDSQGSPVTTNINSTGSLIDNFSFNYIHYAWDWQVSGSGGDCVSCGDVKQKHTVPTLELLRYHRSRDNHEHSSFGPGVFHNYDLSLQITTEGTGSKIILFDPNYYWRIQYEDGLYGDTKDGIFYEDLRPQEKARITDKLTLYDGPMGTGSVTSDISVAQSAVVRTLHGKLFYFDIVSIDGDLVGRLARWEDRRGYGVSITYKTFTPAEIAESPERQLQLDTATDANGRVMSFAYHPTQIGLKWVISAITLPNQEVVLYH